MNAPFRIVLDEVYYFTDGSLVYDPRTKTENLSSGFVTYENNTFNRGIFEQSQNSIHYAEAKALNMAIDDIKINGNLTTKYRIFTDSNALVDCLNNEYTKDSELRSLSSEVREKLNDIDQDRNIEINLIKSHCTPGKQRLYFKRNNNKKISYEEACTICRGNNVVDSFVKGNAYTGNEYPSAYGSVKSVLGEKEAGY